MSDKLGIGAVFPDMKIDLAGGGAIDLPHGINVTDIIKWARRRRADARAPQLLAPLALGKAWVGV